MFRLCVTQRLRPTSCREDKMPKKYGPLVIFSGGWDLKLPFGFWFTYSRPEGGHAYISMDGTPSTGVFHFKLPWHWHNL